MTCDAYCNGCYYFGLSHQTCDYWEKADQLRGCPPGKGCTKKITKKEYMKMGTQKSWNKAAGFEMWKAGKSDKEIGDALGVTAATVSYYRKKYRDKCTSNKPVDLVPAEPEEETVQPEPVGMEANIPEASEPEDAAEDYEPEAVVEEDPEEVDARLMIRALENFVRDLKGMRAVLTFQVLQQLWNWKTVEDLKAAQTFLEGLIELERGNV